MKRGIEKFFILTYGLSSFTILFIISPIIAIYLMMDPKVFTYALFKNIELASEAWSSLALTFEASIISTTVLLVIGIPLAYSLARLNFRGKSLIESIVDIPLLTPHIVAGIMILAAFGRRGLLGVLTFGGVEDTFIGIIIVMIFVSTPLMIDTIKTGIYLIDERLEHIARSLGADRLKVFKDIILPLSKDSILAGYILAWARAVSEVGALLIVAYYPKTVNIVIYEWFTTYGLKYAVALSIVLLSIFILLFMTIRIVYKRMITISV